MFRFRPGLDSEVLMRARPTLLVLALLALPLAARAASVREIEKRLEAAIAAKDAAAAAAAVKDLGEADDESAAKAIVAANLAAAGQVDIEECSLAALAGMKSEGARRCLFKGVKSEKTAAARFLLVAALARLETPEAEDAVIEALDDKDATVGAAAVGHLKRHASKATVEKLIRALPKLEKEKKLAAVRKEVASALRDLTGADIDAAQDWSNWWAAQGAGFELKKQAASGKGGDDVVSRLRENHPADFKTVERLSKDDVIVFPGRSDKIEKVLDALKLPFTKVAREKFGETKLDPKQVIIFACNGRGDQFTDDDVKRIRDFVAAGGYLFTADWVLESVTEKVFPGKIEMGGESPGEELVVKIRMAPEGAAHPYNRDVFPIDPFQRENFTWKIHQRTYLLKLGEGVTTLIESEELTEKLAGAGGAGDEPKGGRRGKHAGGGKRAPGAGGATPVAVTYRYAGERTETGAKKGGEPAGGVVLHVLSHFEDQRTKEGDGFALQQLLLNFIVEKQRARAKAP
jgi:hypothetical protein